MPFFTPSEKDNLEKWVYHATDNSISTKLLNPFWNFIASLIPDDVAPNTLSLAGLLCLLQSYYLTYLYGDIYPSMVCLLSALLFFVYQTLDAVDGKHARRTQNSTPLGELFDHVCDNIGIVFIVMTVTQCCNFISTGSKIEGHLWPVGDIYITENMQWHLIHICQYSFLLYHLDAYKKKVLEFPRYTGPGEMLLVVMGFLVSLPFLENPFPTLISWILVLIPHISTLVLCYLCYVVSQMPYSTRNGLSICLIYHLVPRFLYGYYDMSLQITPFALIVDGIAMSVLTSDMIIAKMANRSFHSWIPIMSGFAIFNPWISLGLSVIYYVGVFSQLCEALNLHMFTINRNVYVDGIYDLCHLGHKNLFKNALQFGNRLIVGVMSDEDCMKYKRAPIMTLRERVDAVSACKGVHKVVPGGPCFGLTEEFLKEHKIHVVAHSTEYDSEDDKYYKVPRQMGITRVLPRTEGMSTTELLTRIRAREQ